MSLPQSLAVNLKRFQSGAHSAQRISGDRTEYGSASTMTFNLPRSGVLDLHSIALLADVWTKDATLTTQFVTPQYHSQMIRRVEFVCGGQVISLNQCSDYGFAYFLSRVYANTKARSDYLQSVGLEGNVTLTAISSDGVLTPIVVASEWLGFLSGKHCRYLPMDVLPECQLVIYLHNNNRWTVTDSSAVDELTLRNARLVYNRVDFEDNMVARLWADRISKAPITIPYENVSYSEGASGANTTVSFSTFVNTQSLDYIIATYRKGDYDSSYANRYVAYAGNSTNNVLSQINFNGAPLSSFQANPVDALWLTASALGGEGNALYAPDVDTFANFRDTRFALIHRMKLDTDEVDAKGWITGTSTYGQSMEILLNTSSADTNVVGKKPVIICFSTGTVEVGAGKQIAIAL